MRTSHLPCVLVALSSGSGTAWCQTADELRATYFRGDLSRMEEAARAADVRAEAWMGLMLQNRGRRLEAKEWWRRAAEKGDLWAIISLARMHLADKVDEEAARWFRRGADAGDLGAQHSYALLLL
jgi:TPR repeat protein